MFTGYTQARRICTTNITGHYNKYLYLKHILIQFTEQQERLS